MGGEKCRRTRFENPLHFREERLHVVNVLKHLPANQHVNRPARQRESAIANQPKPVVGIPCYIERDVSPTIGFKPFLVGHPAATKVGHNTSRGKLRCRSPHGLAQANAVEVVGVAQRRICPDISAATGDITG